jgi:GNAT superfamily N-acetyltransferase
MKFIKLTGESADVAVLERLNEEAFPENERNLITDLIATGATVLGVYEYSEAIGFVVIREYKELMYLAYLAVRSDSRDRGIGTAIVGELVNTYFDKQIVVEYECRTVRKIGLVGEMECKAGRLVERHVVYHGLVNPYRGFVGWYGGHVDDGSRLIPLRLALTLVRLAGHTATCAIHEA